MDRVLLHSSESCKRRFISRDSCKKNSIDSLKNGYAKEKEKIREEEESK